MTRRAYRPRQSTLDLVRRIRALDGIARVDILPPTIWNAVKRPARIKVTLERRNPNFVHDCEPSSPDCFCGSAFEPASTTFTMAEAREWLASEEETPLQRMQREEREGLGGYHVNHTTGA